MSCFPSELLLGIVWANFIIDSLMAYHEYFYAIYNFFIF